MLRQSIMGVLIGSDVQLNCCPQLETEKHLNYMTPYSLNKAYSSQVSN